MGHTLVQEMGLTHAEFFRTLPAALAGRDWGREGDSVWVADRPGRVTIRLAPQGERRIAMVRLPVTEVTFEFPHHEPDQAKAFMRHFERFFQRGGG